MIHGFTFWDGRRDIFVATSRTRKTVGLIHEIHRLTGFQVYPERLFRATYDVRRLPSGREMIVIDHESGHICDLAINGSIVLIHLDEEGGDES